LIMKTTYKSLLHIAFSTLVCVSLAATASAQHRDANSGSGSGTKSSPPPSSGNSGGGGVRPSAPSGGSAPRPAQNGGSYQRPQQSNGNVGYTRPQGNVAPQQQRVGVAPQRYGQSRTGVTPGTYPQRQSYTPGQRNYTPRTGIAPGQRNTYGTTPRPYVGGQRINPGYRTYPGTGFERGRESWRNHGYYHYNRGYYSSYYLPRLGFSIGYLPYGYYPFYFGDYQYYYSEGLYYQYNNNEYTVVEPPIGAEVKTLPEKAQSIVINGQQLYELNGVYYQPVTKDDGSVVYEIVGKDGELNTDAVGQQDAQQAPQIGDIVSQLPPDCRKIKVNGEKLFVSPDGIYYQEITDNNHNKAYKIVGLPSDEPDQN
jgi:hypothetical protein